MSAQRLPATIPPTETVAMPEDNPVQCNVTNDAGRIDEIVALIDDGFLNQVL
ncbi:MAG: hypothetical protein KAU10_00030 [Dehalococcoidia bacterium]|nr:hypothetical protein [Dehalococcoidia bacterium]